MEKWIEYKKCNGKEKYIIKKAKTSSWNEYVSTLNYKTPSQEIWRYIKILNGRPATKTIALKSGNLVVTKPKEVSSILAEHYATHATEIAILSIQPTREQENQSSCF